MDFEGRLGFLNQPFSIDRLLSIISLTTSLQEIFLLHDFLWRQNKFVHFRVFIRALSNWSRFSVFSESDRSHFFFLIDWSIIMHINSALIFWSLNAVPLGHINRGSSALANEPWFAGADPLRALKLLFEIFDKLLPLSNEVFEWGQEHSFCVLDLHFISERHDFLLKWVSKVDEISKILPVFYDEFVVVINPTALIAFHDGSQLLVEESEFSLHLCLGKSTWLRKLFSLLFIVRLYRYRRITILILWLLYNTFPFTYALLKVLVAKILALRDLGVVVFILFCWDKGSEILNPPRGFCVVEGRCWRYITITRAALTLEYFISFLLVYNSLVMDFFWDFELLLGILYVFFLHFYHLFLSKVWLTAWPRKVLICSIV